MATTNYYTVNGEIIGEHTAGQSRLDYLPDGLGSVIATIDQTLTVKSTARFKPYGADLATTGNTPSFGFAGNTGSRRTGRPNTDLYNLARHLGTVEGQWSSIDPSWPTEMAYTYSGQNPTTWKDPTGLAVCQRKPGCDTKNPCLGLSFSTYVGITFCCDGRAVVCVDPTLPKPVYDCILLHESHHQTHLDCAGKPDSYSPDKPCEECDSYQLSILCLKDVNCIKFKGAARISCLKSKFEQLCASCAAMKSKCNQCGKSATVDQTIKAYCESESMKMTCANLRKKRP